MTYWRPSCVGELIMILGVWGGAMFAPSLPTWVRAILVVFGFATLMALRGHEGTISEEGD